MSLRSSGISDTEKRYRGRTLIRKDTSAKKVIHSRRRARGGRRAPCNPRGVVKASAMVFQLVLWECLDQAEMHVRPKAVGVQLILIVRDAL